VITINEILLESYKEELKKRRRSKREAVIIADIYMVKFIGCYSKGYLSKSEMVTSIVSLGVVKAYCIKK
jgi:hypothetical protein